MNYLVFVKKDEPLDDLIVQLKKIAMRLNMKVVDTDFYGNYPIHNLKLIFVSENEFNIRKTHETQSSTVYGNVTRVNDYTFKIMRSDLEEYAEYVIFYEAKLKDEFLAYITAESEKKLPEKNIVKYTRFRDIPQLTRCGNWECDFTLNELVNFIENEISEQGLEMNPDFQRGHVWTEEQQIAFIEFFLRGGKTGRVIYLNNPSWNFTVKEGYNDYVCVDGLQRYTAIKRFINNEIKVFGSYYSEYTDHLRGTTTMKVNVNDLSTKRDVLQWYIEFNDGGTPHTESEINRVKEMLELCD